MTITVNEALDYDLCEKVTLVTTSVGFYQNGLYVKGSESERNILASVQQPSPKQLEILEKGQRDRDIKLFICNAPVNTVDSGIGKPADKIIRKNDTYEVLQSSDWNSYGHSSVMAAKL